MSLSSFSNANTILPQNISDLEKVSVRIYNLDMTSGGTGSIFRSYKNASHILTNKHVCRLVEQGGYVTKRRKSYLITHYKKFPHHDLCLVRVKKNFRTNLVVAERGPRVSSTIYVSGHPNLLPHVATMGHLSSPSPVQLVTGFKSCNSEDFKKFPLDCILLGGIPLVKNFEAHMVSNLIMPGSSGSPVFNNRGKIIGVIFAGMGHGLSYGFLVPHIFVTYFIQNAHRFKWVKVGTPVEENGLKDRIFNYEKCRTYPMPKHMRDFCRKIKDNFIWRK